MPCRSRKRVVPSESSTEMVEIRPSRFLRIQHHNPKPRDDNFVKEMALYMQYKKSGIPSSGPLTMPKRMLKNAQKQAELIPQNCTTHPLSANVNETGSGENKGKVLKTETSQATINEQNEQLSSQDIEDTIASFPASKSSSVLSSPMHTVDNNKVHSASSVLVALHNASQFPNLKLGMDSINHKKKSNQVEPNNSTCTSSAERPDNNIPKLTNNTNIINKENSSVSDIVIFLIHGVGGSSDIWFSQIQHFVKQGYEVVAPDLIGHGFSCCPKNASSYLFKEIAADMEEMFDRYCKKKNVVIGHSYGSSFATLLARIRTRRVFKLVLVSGGPPTPLAPQPGVFDLPICMLGCIKPCLVCGFKRGAFHRKRKITVSKSEAFDIPTYVLQHTMNGQVWAEGDEFYHNWLVCPTLLIYGAEDKLVTLDEELHMEEAVHNSHLVVINEASHMVMIEAPDEVNELLSNFIQHVADVGTTKLNENNPVQNHGQQPPQSSRPAPDISLRRSFSHLSQKSLHTTRSKSSLTTSLHRKSSIKIKK